MTLISPIFLTSDGANHKYTTTKRPASLDHLGNEAKYSFFKSHTKILSNYIARNKESE